MENRGDIDVSFKLRESSSLFGPLFTFYPPSGLIKVNGEIKIAVTLAADHLGDVYEEFIWDLDDSPEPLSLTFRGKIIGPQLIASVRDLNFGNVAFGFASKTTFRLDNISQIPVNYVIRLEDESLCDPSDIRISKARGSIKELESCEISVEFLPSTVKPHELILSVDVERVATGLVRIPLRACVCVPKVSQNTLMRTHIHISRL